MKIIIKTKSLLEILTPLQSIVNENHLIPILQNVKLDFKHTELIATGNNMEVCCSNSMKLVTKEDDSFCVDYTMLLAIIRSVTDKEITFNIKKKTIDIIHKKGNFDLPIIPAIEFPKTEQEKFNNKANVKGTALRNAIKVANKFVLADDLDAMSNISISIGKKIVIRSTDRNRMFEEKIKGSGDEKNILISSKASLALFSLLEEIKENIEMKYNSNSIYFKFDNKEITIIQQQGEFPVLMLKKILKSIKDAEPIDIDVEQFITSLKRVSIMSSKEKYSTVRLNIKKKKIVISCESQITSTKAEETLLCKFLESRLIGYNYKYLIEILSIFDKQPKLFIDYRGSLFISQKKKVGAISPILLTN